MLGSIGSSLLSGLAYLGGTLDKPGRAVRGLLAGRPREALAALPLPTDAFGITDPRDVTYGVELLGMRKDQPFFSPGGIAGLGAEILLDPLTYLTFGAGALTKLGQAAQKARALPRSMTGRLRGLAEGSEELARMAKFTGQAPEQLAGRPLGGIAQVRLPFSQAGFEPIGQGAAGLRFLESRANPLNWPGVSHAIKAAAPVGRSLRGLFHAPSQGTIGAEVQPIAEEAFHRFWGEGLPSAQMKAVEVARGLQQRGLTEHENLLRPLAENIELKNLPEPIRQQLAGLDWQQREYLVKQSARLRGLMDHIKNQADEIGLPQPGLDDLYAKYFPRYLAEPPKPTKGFGGKAKPVSLFHPSIIGREELYKDVPGGTEALNLLFKDPKVRDLAVNQPNLLSAAQYIRENYLGSLPQRQLWGRLKIPSGGVGNRGALPMLSSPNVRNALEASKTELTRELARLANRGLRGTPQHARMAAEHAAVSGSLDTLGRLKSQYDQSLGLARKVKELDPKYAEEGLPLFGNTPTQDLALRLTYHEKAVQNGKALHQLMGQFAEVGDPKMAPPGSISAREAYDRLGFRDSSGVTEGAANQFSRLKGVRLDDAYVPEKIVEDASRMMKVMQSPEAAKPFIDMFDQLTNLTKAGLTVLWPAFHMRNFVSGLFQNFVTGNLNPKMYVSAKELLDGKVIEGASEWKAFRGMTDEQATEAIGNLVSAHNLWGTQTTLTDVASRSASQLAPAQEPIRLLGPGLQQAGPLRAAGRGLRQFGQDVSQAFGRGAEGAAARTRLNPFNISGVAANADINTLIGTGRNVNAATDGYNRIAGFLELLRKGWDPSAAALEMHRTHYDYRLLSQFERGVARRFIPFYNWTKNNSLWLANQLLTQPGGSVAQFYRAGTRLRGTEEQFLPEWLGKGVVYPIGETNRPGHQRFISSLGLPPEDLPQNVTLGGMLGNLNPLIRMPLEMATGRQFYSGRDLQNLYPLLGPTPLDQMAQSSPEARQAYQWFQQALGASPLSRAARYTRQAFNDPRKGGPLSLPFALNFLTGLRVTDADMPRAQMAALRDEISQRFAGTPQIHTFQRHYVRPEDMATLSPYELALLQLQHGLIERMRNTPR